MVNFSRQVTVSNISHNIPVVVINKGFAETVKFVFDVEDSLLKGKEGGRLGPLKIRGKTEILKQMRSINTF